MLQNLIAVIERAEASSGSKTSITQNQTIGNFVASAYIPALNDGAFCKFSVKGKLVGRLSRAAASLVKNRFSKIAVGLRIGQGATLCMPSKNKGYHCGFRLTQIDSCPCNW